MTAATKLLNQLLRVLLLPADQLERLRALEASASLRRMGCSRQLATVLCPAVAVVPGQQSDLWIALQVAGEVCCTYGCNAENFRLKQ